jgi:SpoIID/LytB domain protein
MIRKLPVFLASLFLLFGVVRLVFAEACSTSCSNDNLDQCIAECNKLLDISKNATKPHEDRLEQLQATIDSMEKNLATLTTLIDRKGEQIKIEETRLAGQQDDLDNKIRNYYKQSYQFNVGYTIGLVFTNNDFTEALKNLSYWQTFINHDRSAIVSTVSQIVDLNASQKKLETDQAQLAVQKQSLETTLAPIKKLVSEAKKYQTQLAQTVGSLSARQQELIAAKIGSLNLSRTANISMACSDDRNIDPGFSPRFAFYTFGIPHRVGMSQFGAYGRAKQGQNYDQILKAYFNFDEYKDFDVNIKVDDGSIHWSGSLEDYVKRIYEVPGDWPGESLKAQAIAARSYALAYTNNGSGSICASQSCQVFKTDPKRGAWEDAVNQTSKKAMVVGGSPIKAWFSSTDGGYTHPSSEVFGGSTSWTKNLTDANGSIDNISDLFSKAYDRESPCFYNAQGWRAEYSKSAWLKSEEVADIVNVILVSSKTSNWDGWDAGRVRQELGSDAFTRIDSVSMSFDLGSGRTTSVTVSGDRGTKTFDGKTFKDYFNVRAPANIAIVGPLFNIEKK